MINIRTEHETKRQPAHGDIIYIHGWFKQRIGVYVSKGDIAIQGWFGIKTRKFEKYNKRRFKVYVRGQLYKFPRYK